MSIFGAMQSGISGLAAQSSAMGAISDNISNIGTIGYKNTNVAFQTLVTKQTSTNSYSPGGVQPVTKQGVNLQGLLSSNASSTALGISGNGYFVVNQAANPGDGDLWAYTRAGDFDIDQNGYLKNTGGFYAQGWSLLPWDGNASAAVVNINGINYMKAYYDTAGNVVYINDNIVDNRNLRPVNLSTIGGTATATKQISFGANLPFTDEIGTTQHVSALIYDSLGGASNISLDYTKTSSNTWGLSTSVPSGSASVTLSGKIDSANASLNDIYAAAGHLEFSEIPANGSTIKINGVTFEFLTSQGATAQAGNVAVDLRTDVVSTADFVKKFAEVIQNNIPDGGRFVASGDTLKITQSTTGEAITIDASKTLSCIQRAVNPNETNGIPTGVFTIDAITDSIKNGAALNFVGATVADYDETFQIDGKTFEFTTADPYAGTNIPISLHNVTATGGELSNIVVEQVIAAIQVSGVNEPGRFVASGSTIQILPSVTGDDITLNTANLGGVVEGRIRTAAPNADGENIAGAWSDNVIGTKLVISSKFIISYDQIQQGSLVPAVTFNADGTPKRFSVDEMSVVWANGSENMTADSKKGTPISIQQGNVGTNDGLTSLSGSFTTNYIKQDGAKFGSYAGVSVDESGVVTALFDNGETRPIAILPLATFSNPNGMTALTGNAWIETDYSGQALLKRAGTHGAGEISSNSLEASTVDLATEFSNMIVTQRAYSAATKIITTADEMLDELTRMT